MSQRRGQLAEVAAVRSRMQQELQKKKQEETARKNPNTAPPTVTALPEIALSAIPLQPAEQKARAHYQELIASFPEFPLSIHARFELAELLTGMPPASLGEVLAPAASWLQRRRELLEGNSPDATGFLRSWDRLAELAYPPDSAVTGVSQV